MTRLTLVALLAFAAPAAAQDTVLGLLSLPEVFGNGPCHPFEPAPISLYATPAARSPIATIRVDQHWSFAPHGGCEGLEVGVHRGVTRTDLPPCACWGFARPATGRGSRSRC